MKYIILALLYVVVATGCRKRKSYHMKRWEEVNENDE
jgi:hypothetical protein